MIHLLRNLHLSPMIVTVTKQIFLINQLKTVGKHHINSYKAGLSFKKLSQRVLVVQLLKLRRIDFMCFQGMARCENRSIFTA